MPTKLYYRPKPQGKGDTLTDRLKVRLARRYWQAEGDAPLRSKVLDNKALDYLQGLVDGEVTEAQSLIDVINRVGAVEVEIASE